MTAYAIAAIPTMYNGRQYRSRLEAKWAAFFDRLGWEFEYEPFDLGNWSPDFLLKNKGGYDVLVEVKPLVVRDANVEERITSAYQARAAAFEADIMSRPCEEWVGHAALVVGVSPLRVEDAVQIGWASVLPAFIRCSNFHPVSLRWPREMDAPRFHPDIVACDLEVASDGNWKTLLNGFVGRDRPLPFPYPDHTLRLWADATNAVQWRGEQATP